MSQHSVLFDAIVYLAAAVVCDGRCEGPGSTPATTTVSSGCEERLSMTDQEESKALASPNRSINHREHCGIS